MPLCADDLPGGEKNLAKYDGSLKFDTNIDSSGFNGGVKGLVESLKKVGVAIAGAFVTKQIIDCTKEAEKYQNALTGLKSIMDGQGKSFSSAQKFIQSYTDSEPASALMLYSLFPTKPAILKFDVETKSSVEEISA